MGQRNLWRLSVEFVFVHVSGPADIGLEEMGCLVRVTNESRHQKPRAVPCTVTCWSRAACWYCQLCNDTDIRREAKRDDRLRKGNPHEGGRSIPHGGSRRAAFAAKRIVFIVATAPGRFSQWSRPGSTVGGTGEVGSG